MRTTLTKKLLKFILPLLVIPILLLLGFYYSYLTQLLTNETVELSKSILIQKNRLIEKIPDFQTNLQKYLQREEKHNLPSITIIDKDMNILADAEPSDLEQVYAQYNKILHQYIEEVNRSRESSLVHYEQNHFMVKPLLNSNKEIFAFTICDYKYALEKKLAIVDQTFIYILLIIAFITFINIVLTILFSFSITHPIRLLIEGTKNIADGDMSHTINISSNDEVGLLVDSFNSMTKKREQVESEIRDLNQNLELKVKTATEENRAKDKQLIVQARSAQMGEMLSMIAHQWRQPLNAISAAIIRLDLRRGLGKLTDDDIRDISGFVQKETQSMSEIINDFMNFFSPDTAKIDFSLVSAIDEAEKIIGQQMESHGIECKKIADESIIIYGHQKEFTHILLNLLSNARDSLLESSSGEQQIRINVECKDENAVICISDNGNGVDETIIQRVFDPYFTTKEQGKGTGIGLYMAKQMVVNDFSGIITVKNLESGGACFTIVIPLAEVL